MKKIIASIMIWIIFTNSVNISNAESNDFPEVTTPPIVEDYLPNPIHIYYCAPTGNNDTGDGGIDNPWIDLIGGQGVIEAGDLVYFRGGIYPSYSRVNFSYSQNRIQSNGTEDLPIVFSNYPGEIAKWDSVDTIWSFTLQDDYQKIIATKVGNEYGIQITGGVSVNGDYARISGVEFINGTANSDFDGGAGNPAMLSIPLNDGVFDLIISHNIFRNSLFQTSTKRMCCIKLFQTTGMIIEYNVFQDNLELYDGAVSFKGDTSNAIVRYNKFDNCKVAIQYVSQTDDGVIDGISINNNLFNSMTKSSIIFWNESGSGIRVFNNVSLSEAPFFYYLNADPVFFDQQDRGEYYNNVINSLAFVRGWHPNGDSPDNLPNYFNYNLWDSELDQNILDVWGDLGYYENAVVSENLGITYNQNTISATAEDNYAGFLAGRNDDNIGGFIWNVKIVHADVNQDLQINTTDAMLTLRNSLGLSMPATAWQVSTTTGDVNCDEDSNSTDAMLLLRYSLELDMSETDWCE